MGGYAREYPLPFGEIDVPRGQPDGAPGRPVVGIMMGPRERLARAERTRAAWFYCDVTVPLPAALEKRRDELDAEIAELHALLAPEETS